MISSKEHDRTLIPAVLVLAGVLLLAGQPALAQCTDVNIFSDDMESGQNGWTVYRDIFGSPVFCTEDEWEQSTDDANSAITSWTNAPYLESGGTDATSQCVNYLQMPTLVIPLDAQDLAIDWFHRYNSEFGYDGGTVQVSTDGTNWITVSPNYWGQSAPGTGLQWNPETLSLSGTFTPGGNYFIRFCFVSDQLVTTLDGWHIDDVVVRACVQPVAVDQKSWGAVKGSFRDEE